MTAITDTVTTPPAASFSMPIALSDLSDDALRRYRSWFDGEILRRARLVRIASAAANDSYDEAVLETLGGEQLDAIARSLDRSVVVTGCALGGHGGGLA